METAEIKKMNTVERIRAMEALWDALIHEAGNQHHLPGMAIFWLRESGG